MGMVCICWAPIVYDDEEEDDDDDEYDSVEEEDLDMFMDLSP